MLVGNTNTCRCHYSTCRAVPQIAAKHIQMTESGSGFDVVCKVCYAGVDATDIKARGIDKSQTSLDKFRVKPRSKNELKKYLKKSRK